MRLTVESGAGSGQVVKLISAGATVMNAPPVVIGRGEQCAVRILDDNASRAHAEVRIVVRERPPTEVGGSGRVAPRTLIGAEVCDLGSRNGTWLNGKRMPEHTPLRMRNGDRIVIGNTAIRFAAEAAEETDTVVTAADADVQVRTSLPSQDVKRVADDAPRSQHVADLFRLQSHLAQNAATSKPDKLLVDAAKLVREALPCERVVILQFDEQGRTTTTFRAPAGPARLVLSETILKRVRDNGEALLFAVPSSTIAKPSGSRATTLDDGPSRDVPASVIDSGIQSAIGVPLMDVERARAGGRRSWISGMLYLDRRDAHPPFTADDLSYSVQIAEILARAVSTARRYHELIDAQASDESPARIIGDSPAIQACLGVVAKVSATDTPVLLLGETGTGKELFARAIHRQSLRTDGPFVALNCAAIPADLLEAELFGHEAGAFTGANKRRIGKLELAHQGSLFLDEIGEFPLDLQPKLLRVLQERTFYRVGGQHELRVDFRLISATNRNLRAEAQAGRFREDLLFRLQVVALELPPLRDRDDDLRILAQQAGNRIATQLGRRFDGFTNAALSAMRAYAWPGNVRELENVVERALVLADGPILDLPQLPGEIRECARDAGIETRPSISFGSIANARRTGAETQVRDPDDSLFEATIPASNPDLKVAKPLRAGDGPAAISIAPIGSGATTASTASTWDEDNFPAMPMKEAERLAIKAAMRHTGGRKGEAAEFLGISWPTLRKKLREHGLDPAGDHADE